MKTEEKIIKELIEEQTEALIKLRLNERFCNGQIINANNKQGWQLELGKIQTAIKNGEDFLAFLKKQ